MKPLPNRILLGAANIIEKNGMTPLETIALSRITARDGSCFCLWGSMLAAAEALGYRYGHTSEAEALFAFRIGRYSVAYRDEQRHTPAECVRALRRAAR